MKQIYAYAGKTYWDTGSLRGLFSDGFVSKDYARSNIPHKHLPVKLKLKPDFNKTK